MQILLAIVKSKHREICCRINFNQAEQEPKKKKVICCQQHFGFSNLHSITSCCFIFNPTFLLLYIN